VIPPGAPSVAVPNRALQAARVAGRIERVIDTLSVGMIALMAVALCWQVFGRYVLGRAPAWTEELARYLMVWLTFLGAAAVLRSGGHLTVTALTDRLPAAAVTAVLWLRDSLLLALCAVMAWYGFAFAHMNAGQESAAMEIPMTIPNAALAVGFALLALQIVLARLAGSPFAALAGDEF
jgi:TRAP-type transport system small permease protein